MSSIKVVLRKKGKEDGTFPLALRITADRKSSYVYLGYYLTPKQWDALEQKVKAHPNAVRLNNYILKKKSEANDNLLNMQSAEINTTSVAVKNTMKPNGSNSFFGHAKVFIENMRLAGKYNRVKPDQSRLNSFREFLNDADITFKEINEVLLRRYRSWLKHTKNLSERSIINNLIIIRTIYNQAVRDKVIDLKQYPFGKDKITIKFPDSIKLGLTKAEVTSLENVLLESTYLNHARNLWLFSFYFAGIRTGDLLLTKWSSFHDGRYYYSMSKNDKVDSLKVLDKTQTILDQYKNDKQVHDLVFPELKRLEKLTLFDIQRLTSYADKRLNKALKTVADKAGITKPLTMHIARHTFGNISGNKMHPRLLQKFYRHADIRTTMDYQQNFIHDDEDSALASVVN